MNAPTAPRELALFGAQPAFTEPVHVGRPNIGDRTALMQRFEDILDSRWLTNRGRQVQELEKRLAERLGVKHCIAMCNATIALEIVTRALGMKGEVIIPSMTFIATAHALQWQEITPVFCDIDPDTHTLDVKRVEEMITPRTSGIVGVHVWGRPCDIEGLADIAQRHNLKLVFDAAHAIGCSHRGRAIGGFGDAEVFSFHATKVLNSFEGGAVTTNDDALAEKVRLMQNFGFAGLDNAIHIGTNGKMCEVSAAMGIVSLDSFDDFVACNKRNYHQYLDELGDFPGLRFVRYDENESNNYQYIVAQVDAEKAGLSRDALIKVLHAENVLARRYFWPGCHRMQPYRSYYPHAHLLLPNTEKVASELLILPTGTTLGAPEISTICAIVRQALALAAQVRRHLAPSQ
ncbi:MAG: aminotransferase class I/II-fold pyridoxal phosphate-dependent enzyme [Pseudomonadota bacterium]|nr:aminotransferase class I/II-fold pyridoxal phosphate-dependent enzyme [Pseudomonadota bacterium]